MKRRTRTLILHVTSHLVESRVEGINKHEIKKIEETRTKQAQDYTTTYLPQLNNGNTVKVKPSS